VTFSKEEFSRRTALTRRLFCGIQKEGSFFFHVSEEEKMKRFFSIFAIACLVFFLAAGGVQGKDSRFLTSTEGAYLKWGTPHRGTPAEVSVALVREDTLRVGSNIVNCERVGPLTPIFERSGIAPEAFRSALSTALATWERASGITFRLIDDPHDAQIVVGAQLVPKDIAFADVVHRSPIAGSAGVVSLKSAAVCLNPEKQWTLMPQSSETQGPFQLAYVLIHEIGHTIGLDHPRPSGTIMGYRYVPEQIFTQEDALNAQELYGFPLSSTVGVTHKTR
jgi:hypothetical protein